MTARVWSVVETYPDGGVWTHTFPTDASARRSMRWMQAENPARRYELVAPEQVVAAVTTEQLLAFEQAWSERAHTAHSGHKEEAIRRQLQITPARFYQLLNRAIDDPEAARLYPTLTNRLHRLRDERDQERARRMNLTGGIRP